MKNNETSKITTQCSRVVIATKIIVIFSLALSSYTSFADSTQPSIKKNLLTPHALELPAQYNTPDAVTLDANGKLIVSVPNFNNDALLKAGVISKPSPPVIISIDDTKQSSIWYQFKESDMHPKTKKIGPMDIAFGPDGNLYVADMQIFWGGEHKSRLLRINVVKGVAKDMDVVAEGFIVANGLVWNANKLYVSESILVHTPKAEPDTSKPKLLSGVYQFDFSEFKDSVVALKQYDKNNPDKHLFATFETSNRMGFGADGVAVDDKGNLYTAIVEDGEIYKTSINHDGSKQTILFSKGKMDSADGITWRQSNRSIYVADFLGNAVHRVDSDGKVETIAKNGDTSGKNGELDQPSDVQLKGNSLFVVNMDMPIAPKEIQTNTKTDEPYGLSVLVLGTGH